MAIPNELLLVYLLFQCEALQHLFLWSKIFIKFTKPFIDDKITLKIEYHLQKGYFRNYQQQGRELEFGISHLHWDTWENSVLIKTQTFTVLAEYFQKMNLISWKFHKTQMSVLCELSMKDDLWTHHGRRTRAFLLWYCMYAFNLPSIMIKTNTSLLSDGNVKYKYAYDVKYTILYTITIIS